MTWVPECDGCGGRIDLYEWPRVAVTGQPNRTSGGPVEIRPGQRVDWCPACTTVAFTAVRDFRVLVRAMHDAGLTGNHHNLGLLRYMGDPISPDELDGLDQLADRDQAATLVQRYGTEGWLVARQAMLLMLQDRARAQPA